MKKIVGLILLFLPMSSFANVTFYGQCNYKGPGVVLGVGEYSAAELQAVGIPDDAIVAVKVPDGFTVTLHENDNFKGRYGTLKKSDSCLDNNGFSNLVSSLSIVSTNVVEGFGEKQADSFGTTTLAPKKPVATNAQMIQVFADCNYAGRSAQLPVGDYNLAQLKKFGLGNNDISSVKLPKGMSITVYENDFLRGDSASSGKDVACIDTGSFANRITSLSVLGEGGGVVGTPAKKIASGVTVYSQCDYRGISANLREGEYTNAQLNALGINNNSISSLQVADGYQIDLFINDFQRGQSGMLNTDNPCLVGRYNDAVTSVIVRKKANVTAATPAITVYAHCNFRGGSVQLPAGQYDSAALKKALVGDNTVSSIKLTQGYSATIYEGAKYSGKSLVLTGDDDCLDNDDMNEMLSSMIVVSETAKSAGNIGGFVAQPNQSDKSSSDDLIAGLTCMQEFVDKNACDDSRWATMERRCNLARVEELSDGYLEGHVKAGNCNTELWDELVRRTANPHLR